MQYDEIIEIREEIDSYFDDFLHTKNLYPFMITTVLNCYLRISL
jgi:hypothetical protein